MLTGAEKLSIKQIIKAPPERRAELDALLNGVSDPDVLISVRETLQSIQGVMKRVADPKKLGLEQALSAKWDLAALCHQSNKVLAGFRSDLTIAIGWEEEITIEAF
jgi:hypothetical protein